jgi:phage host-nuclease inhibitor protein Gam
MDCHSRETISKTESHMREVGDLEVKIEEMQRKFGDELDRIRTDMALKTTQKDNEIEQKNEVIESLKDGQRDQVERLNNRINELELAN